MKPVSLAIAAAALVLLSCSTVQSAPQDSLADKVARLEAQMTQKYDKAHSLVTLLVADVQRLERRLSALESENQLLRIDVKNLTAKLESGGGAQNPGPGQDLVGVALKIDTALAKLKTTGQVEDAVKELVPLSKYSAERMTEALKQIASPDYVASLEKVLARCPPDDLKRPLGEAVKDRIRRTSVARVIGATGDAGLSKILESFTGDPDPIVQVELGQALLACKNKAGVPPLLKALRAPESEVRFRALLTLKRLNKGETYGFDMNKGADENADALKSWDDWWQKEGPKLFE